jgi:hypothetical protein
MMWFSVECQLWPSVKYGLCCSMVALSELELVLLPFYGNMLPFGGLFGQPQKGSNNWTGDFTVQASHIQV